ncbi:MAG: beta-ketoacyl-ACP synthase II [Candidatus Hydrogenedentes bacterium]|nr:beta-ketoacyl-ACP synthase II [Candidatus Hydrogenedentota bacterium]
MTMDKNRVVVTGLGVVSPVGNNCTTFWDNLVEGRSGIRAADFVDERTASRIAGMAEDVVPDTMSPKELKRQSRFILFALEAANQAWAQSGLDMNHEDPYRCGVYLGTGIGGIQDIEENALKLHESGPRRVSPLLMIKGLSNMAAGTVAMQFGLQGPNACVVTACATGAQSIIAAANAIRLGQADVMLCGGTEATVIPYGLAAFSSLRALSTRNDAPEQASRPFDRDRDGFVLSEGAGVLVLESEAHARSRGAEILATLAGTAETSDAYHPVAPRPDGSGAAASMRLALQQAGIAPDQVDYCNAHGTSTRLNDVAESLAFLDVFGTDTPFVSSTKSIMGHLLGAAGVVESIACILTIRYNTIHPNINYDYPDPECPINVVGNTAREVLVDIALSNSLGFGGHNATLVFQTYK